MFSGSSKNVIFEMIVQYLCRWRAVLRQFFQQRVKLCYCFAQPYVPFHFLVFYAVQTSYRRRCRVVSTHCVYPAWIIKVGRGGRVTSVGLPKCLTKHHLKSLPPKVNVCFVQGAFSCSSELIIFQMYICR